MQNADQSLSLMVGDVACHFWEVIQIGLDLINKGHWKGYGEDKGVY